MRRGEVYLSPKASGQRTVARMKKQNIRMAIVVDEYGGFGGIGDDRSNWSNEIVGEIRD